MSPDSILTDLTTLLDAELGTLRRGGKAIAIVPPDLQAGDIQGISCVIQRVPTGTRRPQRIAYQGRGEDYWARQWTIQLISFENNSVDDSGKFQSAKTKIEGLYSSRLIGGQGRYLPPTALNREQATFTILDPVATPVIKL